MKKEQLYETLGDINENYIHEAHRTQKHSPVWFKWCAVAACLCLLLIGVLVIVHNRTDIDPAISSSAADVAPMVYINNTLYKQSAKQISYTQKNAEFIYIGVIEIDIANDQSNSTNGVPTENFQSNTPIVGSKVYQYGDDIVIEINGKYWLYEILEDDNSSKEWDDLSEEVKMQLDPNYQP